MIQLQSGITSVILTRQHRFTNEMTECYCSLQIKKVCIFNLEPNPKCTWELRRRIVPPLPLTAALFTSPAAHLVKHAVELYNSWCADVLLFGCCGGILASEGMHFWSYIYSVEMDSLHAASTWLIRRKRKGEGTDEEEGRGSEGRRGEGWM